MSLIKRKSIISLFVSWVVSLLFSGISWATSVSISVSGIMSKDMGENFIPTATYSASSGGMFSLFGAWIVLLLVIGLFAITLVSIFQRRFNKGSTSGFGRRMFF